LNYKHYLIISFLFLIFSINCVYANNNVSEIYEEDYSIDETDNYINQPNYTELNVEQEENKKYDDSFEDEINQIITSESDESDYSNIKRISSSRNNIKFKHNDILIASNYTTNYIKTNLRLPATVKINNISVNMNDFLYIMCSSVNSTADVNYFSYDYVTSTTGTNKPQLNLNRYNYTKLSNNIINCYLTNNRNPKNIIINNCTISFEDCIYLYSRILSSKLNHDMIMPNKISIIALYNFDYSKDQTALISTSTTPLTLNITKKILSNSKYEITFKSPEDCTIYYTINGTKPTSKDIKYTKTFQITNTTNLQYFGIKNNGEKTPILSYGINRDTIAYITNKPTQNDSNYILSLSTTTKCKIYYTINGRKPNTNSTQYKNPITINNYTILRYFTVNNENNKTSPIYYYKIINPTPYVTVLNKTDVRDNHQNITIIANKPGIIYYTRNGTTPTKNDKKYAINQMELSIKTQLKTILIDRENKQSTITFYQAPKIITPTVGIVNPLWDDNNKQIIQILTSNDYKTIYYTTDNSNPKDSNTRKILGENSISQSISLNNGTIFKYYIISNEGYSSEVSTYKVPKNQYEKTTAKIVNTTNVWNNGQQRFMIQFNQPVSYNVKLYKNNTLMYNKYPLEYTIDKTYNVIISYKSEYEMRKEIEYNIANGQRTRMRYTYLIEIPYQKATVYNDSFRINLTKNDINNNLNNNKTYYYSKNQNKLIIINSTTLNNPGLIIYKRNNTLYLKTFNYVYNELNQVSIVKRLIQKSIIQISTIENSKTKDVINIHLPNLTYTNKTLNKKIELTLKDLKINTSFTKNSNTPHIKSEILKAYISNNNKIESIQTYILTYNEITNEDMNNWKNLKTEYDENEITYLCYGMFLSELTYVYFNEQLDHYYAEKLNLTITRLNDFNLLISVNTGDNYMDSHYISLNPIYIKDYNKTNIYSYNLVSGIMASYLEKYSMGMSGKTSSSAVNEFFNDLHNNKYLHVKYRNNTIQLNTQNNSNYTITINEKGQVDSIIHNIYYPPINNTIIINQTDHNPNKLNHTENGGVTHNQQQNSIDYTIKDVNETIIIYDQYNKKILDFRNAVLFSIKSLNLILDGAALISIKYSGEEIILAVDLIIKYHYLQIYYREQLAPEYQGGFPTHKNYLDDYDYIEIQNKSNPLDVDVVEIPYNKFGYDRENAVYIDYYTGTRKMTVEETYKYFPED